MHPTQGTLDAEQDKSSFSSQEHEDFLKGCGRTPRRMDEGTHFLSDQYLFWIPVDVLYAWRSVGKQTPTKNLPDWLYKYLVTSFDESTVTSPAVHTIWHLASAPCIGQLLSVRLSRCHKIKVSEITQIIHHTKCKKTPEGADLPFKNYLMKLPLRN